MHHLEASLTAGVARFARYLLFWTQVHIPENIGENAVLRATCALCALPPLFIVYKIGLVQVGSAQSAQVARSTRIDSFGFHGGS
jgi:hypothetical protein